MHRRSALSWLALILVVTTWAAVPGPAAGPTLSEVPVPTSGENPRHPQASLPVPLPGQAVREPGLDTTMMRVTRAEGGNGRHEYARHDPFNADGSYVLLLPEGAWRIFRTRSVPYNQPSNHACTLKDVAEPRWDPTDPKRLWGLQDLRLVSIRVRDGAAQVTTVKDFRRDPVVGPILKREPDLYRVTMKNEGEPSADMRYWAFIIQGSRDDYRPRYIFTWDRREDRVLGLVPVAKADADLDWVGMSTQGRWVLIGGMHDNRGRFRGLTLADPTLKRFQRIDYTTSHADVGLDCSGREVVVMQNNRTDFVDMITLDWGTKAILEGSDDCYAGTGHTPLVRLFYASDSPFNLQSGVHISANAAGLCVISTYQQPGTPETNWLDRSIIVVRLDASRPRAWYVAKTHNTTKEYWEETHASLRRDGRSVVWATNWGRSVGKTQMFLMQSQLPPRLGTP